LALAADFARARIFGLTGGGALFLRFSTATGAAGGVVGGDFGGTTATSPLKTDISMVLLVALLFLETVLTLLPEEEVEAEAEAEAEDLVSPSLDLPVWYVVGGRASGCEPKEEEDKFEPKDSGTSSTSSGSSNGANSADSSEVRRWRDRGRAASGRAVVYHSVVDLRLLGARSSGVVTSVGSFK